MPDAIRVLGFAILVTLPGAWITFVARPADLPFWARLLIAVALTPLVLGVQFYALRLLGAPFALTTLLLVGLNLPAAFWVWREARTCRLPDRGLVAGWAVVLAGPLAGLAPQLLDAQARAYSGHAWVHADIVYMIANGALVLDDPQLAGVRLGYYWFGHAYQALLSHVLDSAPVASYIWTNLVFLLVAYGFVAGITAELGGQRFARLSAVLWLSFGVNFVGYTAGLLVRGTAYGDPRYTPWLLYYLFFHGIVVALGAVAAIVYLAAKRWPDTMPLSAQGLVLLLLCSVGLVYPILLGPAMVVVAAAGLVAVHASRQRSWRAALQPSTGLAAGLVVAAAVTSAHLSFVMRDRTASPLHLHSLPQVLQYARTTVIVTFPLLAGFLWTLGRRAELRRDAMLVLGAGGLASCVAYSLLSIPPDEVQYKFIFTAALCLAPFPGLALEPLLGQRRRLLLPALAVTAVVLTAPFGHVVYRYWPWGGLRWEAIYPIRPVLDMRQFDLRLAEGEEASDLFVAVRERTPTDSLLVVDFTQLHLNTLTQRGFYAPPPQEKWYPGANQLNEYLLTKVRGYAPQILAERRQALDELFFGSAAQRQAALAGMRALERPLVVLLDIHRHGALREWLVESQLGHPIAEAGGLIAWLTPVGE
jgi:hypothetical protein